MVRRARVLAAAGLHARPAAVFVQAVADSGLPVRIARPGGQEADARSILSVLALDFRHGDEVVLTATGPRAGEVLQRLATVLETAS